MLTTLPSGNATVAGRSAAATSFRFSTTAVSKARSFVDPIPHFSVILRLKSVTFDSNARWGVVGLHYSGFEERWGPVGVEKQGANYAHAFSAMNDVTAFVDDTIAADKNIM